MKFGSRVFVAALAAMLLGLATTGNAQVAPRSYAVMSLIGNEVSIHTVRHEVGVRVSGENRSVAEVTDPVFDDIALRMADTVIKGVQSDAKPVLMMTQDKGLYKAQNEMFESIDANKDNREYLLSLLKDRQVSHLVLITKLRDNAALKMARGQVAGNGRLEGLGFFIDDTFQARNIASNESEWGIVAPFAYVKIRLLDARTLEVVRESRALESHVLARSSATADAMGTWNAVSSEEKINFMRSLIRGAMEHAIPELLAK